LGDASTGLEAAAAKAGHAIARRAVKAWLEKRRKFAERAAHWRSWRPNCPRSTSARGNRTCVGLDGFRPDVKVEFV